MDGGQHNMRSCSKGSQRWEGRSVGKVAALGRSPTTALYEQPHIHSSLHLIHSAGFVLLARIQGLLHSKHMVGHRVTPQHSTGFFFSLSAPLFSLLLFVHMLTATAGFPRLRPAHMQQASCPCGMKSLLLKEIKGETHLNQH